MKQTPIIIGLCLAASLANAEPNEPGKVQTFTAANVQAKLAEYQSYVSVEGTLTLFGGYSGIDFSGYDLDTLVGYVESDAIQTFVEGFTIMDPDRTWTLRQIAEFLGVGGFAPIIVGQVPDKSRSSADAKEHNGRDEVIAWAQQRAGGGRGFGFTGADLHKSWGYESQRKLVVNGILWSAGLEVPKDGAKTTFAEEDLNKNLDKKATPAPKAATKAKKTGEAK